MSKRVSIPDSARSGGLAIFGASGWGKSRLLGRRICYQDTLRGIGQVVIDPAGATIDNLLDRILYLPKEKQLEVGARLRYVNMSGQDGYVVSWPMLVKLYEEETSFQTVERVVKLLSQTDKNFQTASIQGLFRAEALLRSVGKILLANQLPLTAAEELLLDPRAHLPLLQQTVRQQPELDGAVGDLLDFSKLSLKERENRTEPLRNRLNFLKHDTVSRLMFAGSSPPLLDWEQVARDGLTVLIDLRGEVTSPRLLLLKLFWVWGAVMEHIRRRGSSGHNLPPLSLVIDELTYFVRGTTLDLDWITEEFRELIQVRKRNARIYLTVSTQEQKSLPKPLLQACLQMGNLLFGATTDEETAEEMGRRWGATLNPYKVKDIQVHMGVRPISAYPGQSVDRHTLREYGVTGESKTFMPLTEQAYLNSRQYKNIPKGVWFFGQSVEEGEIPRFLRRVSTRDLDPTQFVNGELVTELKRRLMKRNGVPVEEVLTELQPAQATQGKKQQNFTAPNVYQPALPDNRQDQPPITPVVSSNLSLSGRDRHIEKEKQEEQAVTRSIQEKAPGEQELLPESQYNQPSLIEEDTDSRQVKTPPICPSGQRLFKRRDS